MLDKNSVVVAMSGGVDSSLTAALLKEKGYNVIGITMQIWPSNTKVEEDEGCCSLSAVEDARRVADKLDIPFYVLNFKELFEEKVIRNFKDEYGEARTPNPCIVCNKEIKFKAFLQKAKELGAYYMATGHYAKIERDGERYLLKKGKDKRKDQSYMLYNLTQEQLKHALFPLSDYEKMETREMSQKIGLKVHNKPESQEICFVPNDDYGSFLKENYPKMINPGNIVDLEGKVLGRHQGLPFYTIGQRKGLDLNTHKKYYVVKLDKEGNRVVVGDNEDVFSKTLVAKDINWIGIDSLREPLEVEAKIRYNATAAKAIVYPLSDKEVRVEFEKAERAITPGQSVVFYDKDIVLGGGIIK